MCVGFPVFVFSSDGALGIAPQTKYGGGIRTNRPHHRKKRVRRRLPKTWRERPLT
jgi:hypothetical protein